MNKPRKPATTAVETAWIGTEFLLYDTEDGQTRIEVRMSGETVWLSLNQLSELFGRDKSVISRHIRNVFSEGNWCGNQLLQFLQQLPPTARPTRSIISTSTSSSR